MTHIYIKYIICLLILSPMAQCNTTEKQISPNGDLGKIKILSYNIRNAKGMDDIVDYDRIATVINRIDANCVAIQELDSATQRSNGAVVLDEIAKRTKMYSAYSSSIDYQGGKYGIGILTKERPIRKIIIPLPGREEKRSLLLVEMENYIVCCTHWSLNSDDRKRSVDLINETMKKHEGKPIFLAGDLNAVPIADEIQKLKLNWQILNNEDQYTSPSIKPSRCIDYILIKKNSSNSYELINSKVEFEPLASDHLPVWVEVKVN